MRCKLGVIAIAVDAAFCECSTTNGRWECLRVAECL
jgi:hypothetical protein